jgi:hypothetical protein
LLAAVGAASVAGCSAVLGERRAELGCLFVENRHWRPHVVRMTVERDGEVLQERSVELPAATYRDGDRVAAPREFIGRDWPDGVEVTARLEDGDVVDDLGLADRGGCVDAWEVVTVEGDDGPDAAPDAEPLLATLHSDCGGALCPEA